jgi:hypothetical protein
MMLMVPPVGQASSSVAQSSVLPPHLDGGWFVEQYEASERVDRYPAKHEGHEPTDQVRNALAAEAPVV